MAPRRDAYEAQHAKNRLLYEKEIRQIFTKVCYECGMSVTQLASIVEQAGKDVKFAQIPAVRKVLDKLQRRLAERLKTTVENGVKAEWKLANDKYDALIGSMAGGDYLEQMSEQMRLKTMARNMEALNAFLIRKEEGLNLSQRVWKYSGQMRDAMEVALELGISEGQSASEIARDLKQYLNYPDKLFRRVRDEETGELKISKPASMFHPGQGVYRSSYKNALRLALNETNIAYRKSDSIRRQGLDFVVGIEIHLSNNHNCKGVPEGEFVDICDELKGKYPPDFEFVGWHPNCRCWTSAIVQTEEEYFRDSDGIYRGSVNEVKDVPPQFKEWLAKNQGRIEAAEERGTLPYFLRDNQWAWKEDAERPYERKENTALAKAEERHAARTEKQVKDIKAKWDMRSRALKNKRYALALLDSISGMEDYLKKDGRGYSLKLLRDLEPLDGEYDVLDAAARSIVSGMAELKKHFAVLDKPLDTMKKWGVDTTQNIVSNVKRTMAKYDGLSWKDKAERYRYEAQWIEANRKDTIPTWREAQAAYLKAAKLADFQAEWGDLKDKFDSLSEKATDTELVEKIRASMGKDKEAVKKMLAELELSAALLEIQQKYELLLERVPERALPKQFKDDVERAIAERNLSAATASLHLIEVGVDAWEDAAYKIRSLMPEVKDSELRSEILRVLKDSTIGEVGDLSVKVEKYVNFLRLSRIGNGLLKERDLLEKTEPTALTALEEALNDKDMDTARLRTAISLVQRVLNDWNDLIDKLNNYKSYSTTSKAYTALVDDAKRAADQYDKKGLIEALDKLKEKKEQLEGEKKYWEGVNAEWEKMKADVQKVSDALNKDADLHSKATTSGLTLSIVTFQENEAGPRRLREARKTYKEIMDSAEKLGVSITGGKVTLDDLKRIYGDKLPETLKKLDKAIAKEESNNVRDSTLKDRDRIEKFMLEWLSQGDLGMNINMTNLRKVLTSWFKNTFEVGTSGGYRGPSGDLSVERGGIPESHSRLRYSHLHFLNGQALSNQLKRSEYEKYGNLLNHDILESLKNNHAYQYGDIQVRFKREKVIATWTPCDSLGGTQPSLVTDPKVASFGYSSVPNSSLTPRNFEDAFGQFIFSYCELQFHGDLTPECVESIAFPYDITTRPDALQLAKDWKDKYGVKVYYMKDRNTLMTL